MSIIGTLKAFFGKKETQDILSHSLISELAEDEYKSEPIDTAEEIIHWLDENVPGDTYKPELDEDEELEDDEDILDEEDGFDEEEEEDDLDEDISEDDLSQSEITGPPFDKYKLLAWLEEHSGSLMHKGTPHEGPVPHSGRYPWGSGEHPGQHESWFKGFGMDAYDNEKAYNGNFNKFVRDLRKSGLTYKQIADGMDITVNTLKARISLSKAANMAADQAQVKRILASDPTLSNVAIGKIMGINESQVRRLRADDYTAKSDKLIELAEQLKQRVDEKGYVDVTKGSEVWVDAKKTKLDRAVSALTEQGYSLTEINLEQVGNPGKYTKIMVLGKPGETQSTVWANKDKIVPIVDVDIDESVKPRLGMKYPPTSLDSSRIFVKYAEDGGKDMDGCVQLRPGVEDISLGKSKYAQVRIMVDGTHYIKGMAVYSDDVPPGYDVVVNTNKHRGVPLLSDDPDAKQVLKPLKRIKQTGEIDMDNPFGATIQYETGQREYIDENGIKRISPINKVNDEGDWKRWKKTISSQVLSKQPVAVAEKQLDLAWKAKLAEHDGILALTNDVVKKKLLEEFAESCDSASVDLKAAALPRQASHVLIPIPNMPDNECYCPRINTGEKVVLIRYPHEGTFQIPELTVNNNRRIARSIIGPNSIDAVGISAKVAEQLSGADFDGDTVLVIPNNNGDIRAKKAIRELVEFDAKELYPAYPGMKVMKEAAKQKEMGIASNLITDMTLQGAPTEEIVKAVKYSMTVIDAPKHKLNWRQSYIDNDIAELHKKWQGKASGGGATLISRARGQAHPEERTEGQVITDPKTGNKVKRMFDPETGEKLYTYTGREYPKGGKMVRATQESTQMAETKDARTLMSKGGIGTPIERVYANFANNLKALANRSRVESGRIATPKQNKAAKEAYAAEVASLRKKVDEAVKHAPLERQAQLFATATVEAKKRQYPELTTKEGKEDLKKVRNQALATARNRFGGGRKPVEITDREWEAVEAGAVSSNLLNSLLLYADSDRIRQLAMPKQNRGLTSSQERLIKSMSRRGYTLAEIAGQIGVSESTVSNVVNS